MSARTKLPTEPRRDQREGKRRNKFRFRGLGARFRSWTLQRAMPFEAPATRTRPEFWKRTPTETEDSAAQAARGWLNNPANEMSLPQKKAVADTDGDGLIDKKEFQQLFDLDNDGSISQHEMEKAAKLFALVDKDGDGQLTAEEMKQLAHARDVKFKARNN